MQSPNEAPRNETKRKSPFSLTNLLLLVVIVVVGAIGFLAVDTLLQMRRSALGVTTGLDEAVQSVINPTPTITVDPVTIILEIRSLARLETASYTVEKVITAESGQGPFSFLTGDKLLLVAHGQVIAGVDLSKMTEEDIIVSGDGTVFVTLPAAEVFVATLDNDATYVYDRDTGALGQQQDLETLARQEAERRIEEASLEDGILQMAQDNAEGYVRSLLIGLGFDNVEFIVATPMAP